MLRIRSILRVFMLGLILGSCIVPQPGTELPPSDPQVVPTESLREESGLFDPTLEPTKMESTPPVEKFVALSKQDLAGRLGIEVDKVRLVKTAEMLWLNEALGCPRPGMFYPTGRVPGFQVWLDVEGTEYIYNTDFNGTVILCPELNPHAPNADTGPTPGVPIR